MKWLIASDIHGSAKYCRLVIEAFEREKADRILLLGDLLYHGPRNDLPEEYAPKEVFALLNRYKGVITAVRGNCDAEVDQMVLEFPIMADTCLIACGEHTVAATHGHIYNETNPLPLRAGDVLLHGHTHVPRCDEIGGVLYMNPGSASMPKDGSWHGYMTLEDGVFLWKDMDGTEMQRKVLK